MKSAPSLSVRGIITLYHEFGGISVAAYSATSERRRSKWWYAQSIFSLTASRDAIRTSHSALQG